MAAIRIENLVRGYGRIEVLKGLSMTVDDGSIYGLLGPSGCGKTTLLKVILGFLAPDAGNVDVKGTIPGSDVGYAPQEIFELYDRAADPDEFTSTYRPNHPEVARLRGWLAAFDESQTRQPVAPQLDPDQLRALEALGYRESLEPSARVR